MESVDPYCLACSADAGGSCKLSRLECQVGASFASLRPVGDSVSLAKLGRESFEVMWKPTDLGFLRPGTA